MTIRKANKSDHIDGTFVPRGTLFYVAVSHFHLFLLSMLLSINRFESSIHTKAFGDGMPRSE